MNSDDPTMVGTVVNTGIDLDIVGGTSGVQTNVGLDVNVSGADTNWAGLFSTVPYSGSIDVDQFKAITMRINGDTYWAQKAQLKIGRWDNEVGGASRTSLQIALAHTATADKCYDSYFSR